MFCGVDSSNIKVVHLRLIRSVDDTVIISNKYVLWVTVYRICMSSLIFESSSSGYIHTVLFKY